VGPGAILTNARSPRAINPDGSLKADAEWEVGRIYVKRGASLGSGSVILSDVTIGEFALVVAGAVVTRSVPDHGLVAGVPARLIGYVCRCGRRLTPAGHEDVWEYFECAVCNGTYRLPSLATKRRWP
jgi:acetyltransferase-like isoleucine patch superfamily enzyme